MTDAGNQLLTQANANGVGVVIDSLVISNNKPQGDLSNTDKSFFSITIPINATTSQGNTLQVEAVLNNTNFSADYPVNTIGITAHMQNDNNSVLLAIAEADSAIIIPASADIQYTQYFDFSITNDKQANITAEINPAGIVSNDTFSNAVNSLSATDSNNSSSLSNTFSSYASNDSVNSEFNSVNAQLTSYATNSSLASYATNSALSSVISQIPSSANFSGYATISNVATQIASTESYASSVATSAVNASAVIDNHNNAVTVNGNTYNVMAVYSVNTDANTLTIPGYVFLQPNLNHTNVPVNANWDYIIQTMSEQSGALFQTAWSSGFASYWYRSYWNNNGNWSWTTWATMATTNDTNSAYQNAVNTASAYTNQQVQSIASSASNYAVQDNHDGTITFNGNRYVMQQSLPLSTDLNTLTAPGNYSIAYGNTPNKPSSFMGGIYLLVMGNGTDVFQLGVSAGSSPMWRMKQWGSWTNWNNL